DEDKPREWLWHSTAGKVIGQQYNIHQQWKNILQSKKQQSTSLQDHVQADHECYKLFTSRLDWEIAHWAVTEKISQKALDHLLQVPQVQQKLGLTYKNSKGMLKCIDEIPERCGNWYTKQFSFRDKPDEQFTVHHRNPVEAIKALWGDPAFAENLVYRPGKLFRGGEAKTEDNRIFSEMWTTG
ncbi:hypothetical protein BDP27DRAFT_1173378, partial [Rhodocollybia butyracea]